MACRSANSAPEGNVSPSFAPGTVVIVSLANPREKFWGAVQVLSPAGLSVRGADLNSLENLFSLLRTGEPANPSEVFFPMHRVERMEADRRNGNLPSVSERFLAATGQSADTWFAADQSRSVGSL